MGGSGRLSSEQEPRQRPSQAEPADFPRIALEKSSEKVGKLCKHPSVQSASSF